MDSIIAVYYRVGCGGKGYWHCLYLGPDAFKGQIVGGKMLSDGHRVLIVERTALKHPCTGRVWETWWIGRWP